MLIKLNEGESVTIQMNHDKSKVPHSYTIIRRGNWMNSREFRENPKHPESCECGHEQWDDHKVSFHGKNDTMRAQECSIKGCKCKKFKKKKPSYKTGSGGKGK